MTAPVQFTIKVKPRSWRCSCGQKLGLTNVAASIRTADDHAAWHAGRGESTSCEIGALTSGGIR